MVYLSINQLLTFINHIEDVRRKERIHSFEFDVLLYVLERKLDIFLKYGHLRNIITKGVKKMNDFKCSNTEHFDFVYKNVTAKVGKIEIIIPLCRYCYNLAFNENDDEDLSDEQLKKLGWSAEDLKFNENFEDLG